jgi:hypothetical protein
VRFHCQNKHHYICHYFLDGYYCADCTVLSAGTFCDYISYGEITSRDCTLQNTVTQSRISACAIKTVAQENGCARKQLRKKTVAQENGCARKRLRKKMVAQEIGCARKRLRKTVW